MKHSRFPLTVCTVAFAMLAGCATTSTPDIRVNQAPDANFTAYGTFGFPEQTGTDRGGYSTLVTSYFKAAVRNQMEQRGYHYVDENPDLLVNFYMNTRERTEIRPGVDTGFGYYGYRSGLYRPWYDDRTVNYQVGTINVDIVDAAKKQLIWEGVAEGRVSEEALANPKVTINGVVTEMMRQYPGKPNM